jgi:uncharacterized DUF497 family protein
MEQERSRMRWTYVIWDHTEGGNVGHVEAHDLTTDDVDYVIENHESTGFSRSSDRPCLFGHTPEGRYVIVVYEVVDTDTIIPVTAYEVEEP